MFYIYVYILVINFKILLWKKSLLFKLNLGKKCELVKLKFLAWVSKNYPSKSRGFFEEYLSFLIKIIKFGQWTSASSRVANQSRTPSKKSGTFHLLNENMRKRRLIMLNITHRNVYSFLHCLRDGKLISTFLQQKNNLKF